MFEPRHKPVLSLKAFLARMAGWLGITLLVMLLSLGVGMTGYWFFEGMPWIDAFLNAAMILGGMGPMTPLATVEGKLFAGLYALYCGILLVVCGGLLLVPVFHRVLHRFHADKL
jgi:hypothetical protein